MELFENDETVRKSPTEVKRTRSARGDGGDEKESTVGERAVGTRRPKGGGQKSRCTDTAGTTEARPPADIRPAGGTRSVDPMPARGRATSASQVAPDTSRESPIDVDEQQDVEMVPRHDDRPMGEQGLQNPFERGDGSKDDQRVSRRRGYGPAPLRVSEPSTWQRWPDVQPAAPVNDECPQERAVESLIQSEWGQRWLDKISQGLRLIGNLRDLLTDESVSCSSKGGG